MRTSDDRYTKDRERIDLALRMIQHEARTTTIRHWTGLTDDRIRKLYHTYVAAITPTVRRHRGKSPTQTAFFLKNADQRRQTATLAGLFALLGLLHTTDPAPLGSAAGLERGILVCRTYETYLLLQHPIYLSFEHALRLLSLLQRRSELKPDTCRGCQSLRVIDALGSRMAHCEWCDEDARDQLLKAS